VPDSSPASDLREPELREFDLPAGRVAGLVDGAVVRLRGIPYAVAERFAPPRAMPALAGEPDAEGRPTPFLATEPGPAAPQRPSLVIERLLEGASEGVATSEACQTLAVTAPADVRADERLPVIVWVHGGSYVTGAADVDLYDPRALVEEQRVIVVLVGYRLGVLGFLGDGSEGGIPANLGLLDLVAAVRWVHDNAAAFGGDPDRITLAGQSAGGDAVAHLMISEGATGRFRRAIVQSAPLGLSRGRARMAARMLRAVGDAAHDTPLEDLLRGEARAELAALRHGRPGLMPFGVVYGRHPLPAEAERDAAWRAAAPQVDLLIGSTSHETGLYAALLPVVSTLGRLPLVGALVREWIVRPTSHALYRGPARRFAARHRAAGGRAARYELRRGRGRDPLAAIHVSDVPLLFGTAETWRRTGLVGPERWREIERRGPALRRVWAEFARSGGIDRAAAASLRSPR
jgi:para-nitrobenzyl esterase